MAILVFFETDFYWFSCIECTHSVRNGFSKTNLNLSLVACGSKFDSRNIHGAVPPNPDYFISHTNGISLESQRVVVLFCEISYWTQETIKAGPVVNITTVQPA